MALCARCALRPPAGREMQRALALLRAIHGRGWGHAERLAAEAAEAEVEAEAEVTEVGAEETKKAEGMAAAAEPAAGWAAVPAYVQQARRRSEHHLPPWQRTCPAGVAARLEPFDRKMEVEGVPAAAAAAFRAAYAQLVTLHTAAADPAELRIGDAAATAPADPADPADPAARRLRCVVPDAALAPVGVLPRLERLRLPLASDVLPRACLLRLSGPPDPAMGWARAACMLPMGEGRAIDLVARYVLHTRETFGAALPLLFLHSPGTAADTAAHLEQHFPSLVPPQHHLIQHRTPKLDAADLSPAHWPVEPSLEWGVAGDGALFAALHDSGTLDRLLRQNFRYMLVSDAENLGATFDLKLLSWFVKSGAPIALEVCEHTPTDGEQCTMLARDAAGGGKAGGGLVVRVPLQAPLPSLLAHGGGAASRSAPRFTPRHVSTNSMWLDLQALRAALDAGSGALRNVLPLPPLCSRTTLCRVTASGPSMLAVAQLQSRAAAAVSHFDRAQALEVPRAHFTPLRSTEHLFALASDAYEATLDHRRVLRAERRGVPPLVRLDEVYATLEGLQTLAPNGTPSLRTCRSLRVQGLVVFARDVCLAGDVVIINPERGSRTLRAGWYRNTTYTFRPEPPPPASREASRERTQDLDDAEYGGARPQPGSSSEPGSGPERSVLPPLAPAFAELHEPSFMSPGVYRRHHVK